MLKTKKVVLLFFSVLLCGLVLLAGCLWNSPSNSPPSIMDIDSLFPEAIVPTSLMTCTSRADVYIDCSGSMSGFLAPPGQKESNYSAFLRNLDGYLRVKYNTIRYYQFGSNMLPIQNISSAIRSRSFYGGEYTRISLPFDKVLAYQNDQIPELTLIITDGINSAPESADYRAIIGLISSCMAKGLQFEMVLTLSEFTGNIYPLDGTNFAGSTVYDWQEHGPRPFFVYLVSEPRSDCGRDLFDALLVNRRFQAKYINFSRRPFEKPRGQNIKFEFHDRTGMMGKQDGLSSYLRKGNKQYVYWPNMAKGQDLVGTIDVVIPLLSTGDDSILSDTDIWRLGEGYPKCIVEAFTWPEKKIIADPKLELVGAVNERNAMRVKLKVYQAEYDEPWTVYRVTLKPGNSTVVSPLWVDLYSTDLDSNLECFSRTIYLKDFCESLTMTKQFLDSPLCTFFIITKEMNK